VTSNSIRSAVHPIPVLIGVLKKGVTRVPLLHGFLFCE
jgi:hypothetical protein